MSFKCVAPDRWPVFQWTALHQDHRGTFKEEGEHEVWGFEEAWMDLGEVRNIVGGKYDQNALDRTLKELIKPFLKKKPSLFETLI